ncbi:LysE family translocator [Microbacterium oxydans]|uniref:LysE family translocator n=1 Tax=Microbacterium oxydans TaxID=82380 RepID=UPI00226B2276|nr:LysE family translocator [Microbacterium oxydans]WAA66061.1 LysE family translocator [Microbacterium oxydans]
MDITLVMQFWVVAAMLALTPGADWAYAISAGLRARSIAPSILGMIAGYIVVIVAVAVGLGALVTAYPVTLTTLTVVGALYLVFLGGTTLASRPAPIAESGEPIASSGWAQFLRGSGVSGINPKGLLLLLALLPQFTSPDGWSSTVQMLALGGLHILNIAIVYTTVGLLARRLLRTRPRASALVTRLAGIAMIVIGCAILVEQVIEWL